MADSMDVKKKDEMLIRDLDLKGEVCPYTFVKTKLTLEEMKSGEVLRVVVDYEPAVSNIPRSAASEGHEVVRVQKMNASEWEIVLKKGQGE